MDTPQVFETVAQDGVIKLPAGMPTAAHCVVTVLGESRDALKIQAEAMLSEQQQSRMSALLDRNRESTLTEAERLELDKLSAEFDAVTLAKGRALAAL